MTEKTPTDAELKELLPTKQLERGRTPKVQVWLTQSDALAFARAVLAKFGNQSVEANTVFAAISSGEWKVTRNLPSSYMTDEGNAKSAWTVERAAPPYCANLGDGKGWGNRYWSAPTALEALHAASKEMGISLPSLSPLTASHKTKNKEKTND